VKEGFEDKFMELQSELISLCLEVTNKKVDNVYVYASIEEKSKMFNAFFKIGEEVKTLNQLGVDRGLVRQFLELGTTDLNEVKKLCKEYEAELPTEMKMHYNVETGKYNASYKYAAVCNAQTGVSAGEVFMNWMGEVKQELK